jgi:UDP-3-O-[3-hydroxymyristoyl] N-acetylglucosamine deacetylase
LRRPDKPWGFMISNKQQTVARKVQLSGVALHSGKVVQLEIHPAAVNTGIIFKRIDLPGMPSVLAHVSNIQATELNTTIKMGEAKVATIEHLMAAFAGLGIDNALVKINGPEVPVMDGSAAPFIERILTAGISIQNAQRRYFVVRESFEFRSGDKWIKVDPSDCAEFEMHIDFKSQVIGRQSFGFNLNGRSFLKIAGCRTFCHIDDVNSMRRAGLALGGSLENAVVVSDDEVLNPEGLRFKDEFVRHKLLDCIGDLYLLGGPIVGKVSAYKSGHGLHAGFMRAVWARRNEVLSVVEDLGVPTPERRQALFAGAIA